MIQLLALLLVSFSLNSANLVPNSGVINNFTSKFAHMGTNVGLMDGASNSFVQQRIGDLIYYREYFKHSVASSRNCFCVAMLFTIPVVAKLYKDSAELIEKKKENINRDRESFEKELRTLTKEADEKHDDEARRKLLLNEINKLPSNTRIVLSAMMETIGKSTLDLLTSEFSVTNSIRIIIVSALLSYYYVTCRNFAGNKFRDISSILTLLSDMFQKKLDILKSPFIAANGAVVQKIENINIQIKEVMQHFEFKNSAKKKFVVLGELILNFFKG